MNVMWVWAGGLLALLLYVPLLRGILTGKIVEQSFATWALWVLLDAIALINTVLEKGNFVLLAFYVIGGSVITIALLSKKLFEWTWVEWLTLVLVIICLVVWKVSGSRTAIVASTLAVFIAGVPQIIKSWRKPDRHAAYIYGGYTVANLFSVFGGRSWTIEERFYPSVCVVLCLLITIASFRDLKTISKFAAPT